VIKFGFEEEVMIRDKQDPRRNASNDQVQFPYPFIGEAESIVVVPDSSIGQGKDWVRARIEGWFRHHHRPRRGESVRIPDYQFDPKLFQPSR
jgi:hypothetical protein